MFPGSEAAARLRQLFEQILRELRADYVHQPEVLRSYVHLVLHEAQRLGLG